MIDLSGKRVVVTGGSRGIGAACCRRLAWAGAVVAVHYRTARAAAAGVLDDCRAAGDRQATAGAGGSEHLIVAADLADAGGVDHLFDRLEDAWGGLDCLINNAGIWERNPLVELDGGRLERTWALNVMAVFECMARALPLLRSAIDGNVVNISSTAGQRGEAEYSPYAASKGAIIAATKSWSSELAPEIRANAVAPGWVDTDMCKEVFAGDGRRRIEEAIPLGRVASADDIAAAAVFLASPWARHITGEVLNVNGGSVLAG